MADQSDPVADALRAAPMLTDAQRADAWDAYHAAKSADDLTPALKALPVPATVKAKLWDLKSAEGAPVSAPSKATAPKVEGSGLGTMQSAFETAKDFGAGFVKSAGRSVQGVVDDLPHMFGGAGLSDYIDLATGRQKGNLDTGQPGASYQMAKEGLQPSNQTQRVGGYAETAAELVPVVAGVAGAVKEALPNAQRAGRAFQEVMGAAKDQPIDVAKVGDAALRIKQLAERGASMPQAVNKLLLRMTDPDKGPLVYEESRDFASAIGRLSVDEQRRLTPVVRREIAILSAELNRANASAAAVAGKGAEYSSAMTEYARAMKASKVWDEIIKGAKKAAPWGLAGGASGASYWLGKKLMEGE